MNPYTKKGFFFILFCFVMTQEKIKRSCGVHDGTFHADEVTACAFLILFNLIDEKKIIRTRDLSKLKTCEFVCDVGGIYDPNEKLFDHHQNNYKGEFSSTGMVLLYLKDQKYITPELYDFFNTTLVKGVDDHDNGRSSQEVGVTTFSHVIANYVPVSQEVSSDELDAAFFEALHFVMGHLKRLKERYDYNQQCRKVVYEKMQKYKRVLVFERPIPWLESFFALDGQNHSALFVIMPAGPHWKLRAIPPDYEHRMQVRVPLPEDWAGLLEDSLKKQSGIEGAIFCHKGRFTSVWETKEDALKALRYVFQKNGIENEDNI